MTISTRDPFRLVDEMIGRVFAPVASTTGFAPSLDVRELADEYMVLVDLPGVKTQDVNVELSNQLLTISGTRVPFETGDAQLVERPYGAFSRTLTIPQGIHPDSIRAEYADGVLTLHVPKPAEAQRKKIAITGGSTQKALEA